MRDNKAFASLTSGLLARKGQARPAMRAQGFGFATGKLDDLGWNDMGDDVPAPAPVRPHIAGFGRAERPPVLRQQDEIAEALAASAAITPPPALAPVVDLTPPVVEPIVAPVSEVAEARVVVKLPTPKAKRARTVTPPAEPVAAKTPIARAPRAAGRKAAFTLRIEAERHLRLRLACAVQNRSAQQIVTAALDSFLATLPDVERLATSLSAARDGRKNS